MGLQSRNKGKRGEREAAAELQRLFNVDARRGRQFQGSDESPDVVVDIPDLHFEVKRCEDFRIYKALAQATEDAGDKIPVVCIGKIASPGSPSFASTISRGLPCNSI